MIATNDVVPFAATHPGEILGAELDARGIKQREFADAIGVGYSHLNEFIKGKRQLSADLALKFEKELGIPSDSWMRLQSNYELNLARIKERDEKEREAASILSLFAKIVDLNTIRKRYEIQDTQPSVFLQWFKESFHVETPSDLSIMMAGLFRVSSRVNTDELMARTWVLIARETASRTSVAGSYQPDKNSAIVEELAKILHRNNDTIVSTTHYLSENGIRFCIVPKVANAAIDGYSEIIDGIPTIVLTKRFDRIDNFAFSLMHEIGHIILHLSTGEYNGCLTFEDRGENKEEKEADIFASSHLIPDRLWKGAPESRPLPAIVQRKYSEWAIQNHLNKWIVLGRVSYEFGIWAFRRDESSRIN